jgi:hypothetical protein
MLSWFRKKSNDVTPEQATPAVVAEPPAAVAESPAPAPRVDQAGELIRRWDAMRTAIRARVEAMLAEAAAASEPLIAAVRTDLTPLTLPWNTVAVGVREARDEISEGWNQISDEMSECEGFTHEMMFSEGNKRDLASLELELLHERIYGDVMARAAERMRQYALGVDAAQHTCSHCGAPLDRVTPVSQSLNVECGHCNAISTVHPGDALRMFAASGAMHLAAQTARHAGEAMKRIEKRINQYREAKEVPLALLIELESTSRIYWTTRLTEEARYNPDEAKYVAAKIERYTTDTLKTLRRYWQWREYETTRPPFSANKA